MKYIAAAILLLISLCARTQLLGASVDVTARWTPPPATASLCQSGSAGPAPVPGSTGCSPKDRTIDSYQVDPLGNPLLATRRTFISGLSAAEGAAIDHVIGDFPFSTFGGGNQIVLVT